MLRALVVAFCPVAIAVLLMLGRGPVSGDELLADGGFEGGLDGWSALGDAAVEQSGTAHSGSQALQVSGPSDGLSARKDVPIAPGEAYQLSGFLRVADPDVEQAYLRVFWLDSSGFSDSSWADVVSTNWQFVETNVLVAPADATLARLALVVALEDNPGDGFTIQLDDLSFQGAPAPTAAPATPTPTPTPTPLPSLTQQPTSAPTSSPTPTATPTTATATPHATLPTASVAATPTQTPVNVFPSLTNVGFEEDGADGAPYGWRKIGGTIASASSPVRSGQRSLELRSETTSTKWAYQTVLVIGGAYYEASAYASFTDAGVEAVFVRVSWYASADGSGEALSSADSTILESPSAAFRHVSTGAVQAPPDTHSARVRLMLRPVSGAEAVVYFDDVAFEETEEPAATKTPTTTTSGTPTSSPVDETVTATPTRSPAATKTATPTPTLTASASPTAVAEPVVFAALTNGGFEEAREDGTPYGWHKTGGSVACDGGMRAEGEMSLALSSETDSTKWAYQVVTVIGGAFYEFAGSAAAAGAGTEAFLRVSWYESENGLGEAMSSADSGEIASAGGWQILRTGAVQAPAEAKSAKVRLMLRPIDGRPATAYFDALTLNEVAEPDPASGPTAKPVAAGGQAVANAAGHSTPGTPGPQVLGAAATPIRLANVKPAALEESVPAGDPGDGHRTFWLLLAFAIPVAGFAAMGAVDGWRSLGRR